MSVDPTPTSDELPRDSKEAVRAGTRTRFNLWVLVIGLILVIGVFAVIYATSAGDLATTRENIGQTRQDAASYDQQIKPAEGDSPVDGVAVSTPSTAGSETATPQP